MIRRALDFFLCVVLLFFVFPLLFAHAYAAVVINELFPKTEHADEQWIELFNTGSEPVSLDRWKLQGTTGTFTMNASAIIAPLNFLVFRRTDTGITLAISGDTVRLYDEKNTLIDSQKLSGDTWILYGIRTKSGRCKRMEYLFSHTILCHTG